VLLEHASSARGNLQNQLKVTAIIRMLGDRFASTIDNVENFGEVLAQVPQDLSLFH
jgi:hypothetical protein